MAKVIVPHEAVYEVRCPVRRCDWSVTANVADFLEEAWRRHRTHHIAASSDPSNSTTQGQL